MAVRVNSEEEALRMVNEDIGSVRDGRKAVLPYPAAQNKEITAKKVPNPVNHIP